MLLALVGPTGSGKSALALEAADALGGASTGKRVEIVAVDAFTVYRGMDVGTAKPSPSDRDRVPHHMVDVLDPQEECTVGWFQREARAAVAAVTARGNVPLLVGGSGLYFRAVVDDLAFPPTDPEVRAGVAQRYADDPGAAHAALAAADPEAAARMDPGNFRRAVRALEVLELTGRPFSDWRRAWDTHRSVYPDLRVFGVALPPADLAGRIQARVAAMLEAGWVQEAGRLAARPLSATARRAIGYEELFAHLRGELPLPEAAERIAVRTRQFAARQRRWFRADPRVRWHAAEDTVAAIKESVCGS